MRPRAEDLPDFYARYVERVPDGDLLEILESQIAETLALFEEQSDSQARFRYATGKWSIKEVIGHLIDTERVFAYRALRFARGDDTPLPGFDQDAYVAAARFDDRPLPELLDEFRTVRSASLALFRSFDETAWRARGTASARPISVRAIAYIVAGHERHHVALLREKYLPPLHTEEGR